MKENLCIYLNVTVKITNSSYIMTLHRRMSTNEGTTRYKGRGKYANSLGGKIYGKADTTNGQTCTRPHFELHTKSSLLKRKEPREYTMINLKGLRKPEGNRVSKKRSTVVKQSKSMQTLKTVLTREKDLCQMLDSLSNKCSETVGSSKDCIEKLLVSSQNSHVVINVNL